MGKKGWASPPVGLLPSFHSCSHSHSHFGHRLTPETTRFLLSLPLRLLTYGFIYATKQSAVSLFLLFLLPRPGPRFILYLSFGGMCCRYDMASAGTSEPTGGCNDFEGYDLASQGLFSQCASYMFVYFRFAFGLPCLGYGRAGAAIYGWDCGITIYGKRGYFEIEARLVLVPQ